jgi:hypothetical protein
MGEIEVLLCLVVGGILLAGLAETVRDLRKGGD